MIAYKIENPEKPNGANTSHLVYATLKAEWKKCSRSKNYFLISTITVPKYITSYANTSSYIELRGRPEKSFEECFAETKKRTVQFLVQIFSGGELGFAAELSPSTSARPPIEKK